MEELHWNDHFEYCLFEKKKSSKKWQGYRRYGYEDTNAYTDKLFKQKLLVRPTNELFIANRLIE